jgi:hypothetical protein
MDETSASETLDKIKKELDNINKKLVELAHDKKNTEYRDTMIKFEKLSNKYNKYNFEVEKLRVLKLNEKRKTQPVMPVQQPEELNPENFIRLLGIFKINTDDYREYDLVIKGDYKDNPKRLKIKFVLDFNDEDETNEDETNEELKQELEIYCIDLVILIYFILNVNIETAKINIERFIKLDTNEEYRVSNNFIIFISQLLEYDIMIRESITHLNIGDKAWDYLSSKLAESQVITMILKKIPQESIPPPPKKSIPIKVSRYMMGGPPTSYIGRDNKWHSAQFHRHAKPTRIKYLSYNTNKTFPNTLEEIFFNFKYLLYQKNLYLKYKQKYLNLKKK